MAEWEEKSPFVFQTNGIYTFICIFSLLYIVYRDRGVYMNVFTVARGYEFSSIKSKSKSGAQWDFLSVVFVQIYLQ